MHQPPVSCSRCVLCDALRALLGKIDGLAAYPGVKKMCWTAQMYIRNNLRYVLPLHALHASEESHGALFLLSPVHSFKTVGLGICGLGCNGAFLQDSKYALWRMDLGDCKTKLQS